MLQLDDLVRTAEELEPLPASTTRLAHLLATPDWEMSDIAQVISLDEALTGRLLSAANSALLGGRTEVCEVEVAVMRLGTGPVLSLALGSSAATELRQGAAAYGLAEGELWRHSVACALAVDQARHACRRPIPPQAYAAALLHDVGKLVLARHVTPPLVELLRVAQTAAGTPAAGGISAEVEEEILAIHHAELGAVVARSWGLPESIAVGIAHHHAPLEAPDEGGRLLCNLIDLADAVSAAVGAGCGAGSDAQFSPAHAERLGITSAGFEALVQAVDERLEDVLSWYE